MVQVLIERGADVNWIGSDTGYTAHIAAAISATSNDHYIIDELLNAGADINMESAGRTAVYMAAVYGKKRVVTKLISLGADLDRQAWNEGMTAVMIAIQDGYYDVAVTLIDANANIQLTNDQGLTALHMAAKHNQHDIAQLLLEKGADPNQKDYSGRTPRNIAEENRVSNEELDRYSFVGAAPSFEEPAPLYPFPKEPVGPVFPDDPVFADYQPIAQIAPIEKETSTVVTSEYAVYMLSGGVILSMATSIFFILT